MQQLKILTRTILILFIINFALAAPVAVRGRQVRRLDANVTRNVTTASQKRRDSLEERGSTNVPGPDYAPPPSPDWTNVFSQIPYADSTPSTPTPDYVPYHTPPPSPDLTDILSQIPYADSTPSTPTPDYVPYHTPPPSPDLADILSQIPSGKTSPASEH